ncbi:transglycosylase SLT domain-containing protein [Novosphingobium sp. FSW06-99]|uniref:transglycosylase SLT domain-containing protein n=1 Tax=Novosphingobium sp. FSW06-99 TaxID=1739113 RepID=UPI000AFC5030|nr:transglycosylase SLT domain-containing protein [Novosphingobium sp. FSW06-99]
MSDEIAKLGVAIVADDQTKSGVKAAESRLEQMAKRSKGAFEKSSAARDASLRRSSSRIIGSFSRIEQASARVFGGSSLTAGIAGRMEGVGRAAAVMGDAMGSAASEGGGLARAMGVIGVAAAGTIAVAAAAGYAAFSLASDWAKSASAIGRTADTIGVSTKTLQNFTNAAARMDIDPGAAAGGLGGLSQTLNDARYGANPGAMAVLSRLGIKLNLNKDGTVNTDAMLPVIADKFAKQTSAGKRLMAQQLGISPALIPLLSIGGKALSAEMADAQKSAPFESRNTIKSAQHIRRDIVKAGQEADRGKAWVARNSAIAGDKAAHTVVDAVDRAAKTIKDAGEGMQKGSSDFDKAVRQFGAVMSYLGGGRYYGTPGAGDTSLYARIEHAEGSRQDQVSPKGAIGVMQLMPDTARRVAAGMGMPFDEGRFRNDETYNRLIGDAYLDQLTKKYGGDETLAAAAYNAGEGNVDKWVKRFGDPRSGRISDADFAAHIPYKETRDYVHKVVVEFKNAPHGTTATTHGPNGAISYGLPAYAITH